MGAGPVRPVLFAQRPAHVRSSILICVFFCWVSLSLRLCCYLASSDRDGMCREVGFCNAGGLCHLTVPSMVRRKPAYASAMPQVCKMPKLRSESHKELKFECVHVFQAMTIQQQY